MEQGILLDPDIARLYKGSLRILADQAEPPHQPLKPKVLTRRRFLGLGALSGIAAAAGALLLTSRSQNTPPEKVRRFQESSLPPKVAGPAAGVPSQDVSLPILLPPPSIITPSRIKPLAGKNIAREEQKLEIERKHQVPVLGIRNDHANLMSFIEQLGLFKVRIADNGRDLSKDTDLKEALDVAQGRDFKILYVFNPNKLLPKAEIQARLTNILRYNIDLEIGNEPDGEDGFWENQDLSTFAKFVKITAEEARRIKPGIKIIIGALVHSENTATLLKHLKNEGVDMNNMQLAVHAYSVGSVDDNIGEIRKVTKLPLVATEIGLKGNDRNSLTQIIDRALLYSNEVYLHELPNPADQNMGLVNPLTQQPNQYYYLVQNWVREWLQKHTVIP